MVFLALVPSPPYVAIRCRELLPRGFTLTFSGGLFSVTASIRLLPSVLSTAGCPFQSGLSSGASTSDRSSYLYLNELFLVTELALKFVILCVDLLNSLHKAWSYVLAAFVTLH